MAIDFPNNPISGQTYAYAGQQWQYNGVAWDKTISGFAGNTGATGPQGNTGATGPVSIGGICGSIQYNDGASGLSGNSSLYWNGTNLVITEPNHLDGDILGSVQHEAHNNSGVGITKGFPVYITGMDGASTIIRIAAADASDSAKMPAIGLAAEDIPNGNFGHVVILGTLLQLDTSVYSTNQTLYVASGGGLTATRPTGANDLIQNIGKVGRVHANTGSVIVLGPGRTNDVPNVVEARSWFLFPNGQTASSIVTSFNGLSGAIQGVGSIRGLTGAVGITNSSGIDLSVSGNTLTVSNTGVLSFNGLTGAVTGVTTGTANTFGPLQSFTNGISSAGGTFSALTRFTAGISASGATFATDVSVNNITIGRGSGNVFNNTVFGTSALSLNGTGGTNVAIGYFALNLNTGGDNNTAVGYSSLDANTTGFSNTALGANSLGSATTASYNVSVGSSSLLALTGSTSSYNVAIGTESGYYRGSGASSLTTASRGVFIGYDSRASANNQTNEIVIGSSAVGLGSNTAVIGATSQSSATIYGTLNAPGGLSASNSIIFNGGTGNTEITVGFNLLKWKTRTVTTTTISPTTIFSFNYRTFGFIAGTAGLDGAYAELLITAETTSGSNVCAGTQITKLLITANPATSTITHMEYGSINTDGKLANYSVSESGDDIVVTATPTTANEMVHKTVATLIRGVYGAEA